MASVYQHQLHAKAPRRHHYKVWAVLALIGVVAVILGLRALKPNTQITAAKSVTSIINGPKTKKFDEGIFTINLPVDWTFVNVQRDIYTIYHFKSAIGGDDDDREMDVYVDSNPVNFPVNRMVPVQANGDSLIVDAGEVSDNCTAYTTGATTDRTTVSEQAKWQGVTFLCDMANTARNVVGTGSPDGLNTVVLTGDVSGQHHFFFSYTDDNDKPDYSIFTNALTSFHLK
jgi:hypothetical protein